MAIRIPVCIVIEMNDDQQADYIADAFDGEKPTRREFRAHIRGFVREEVECSFSQGSCGTGADVNIKER